MIDTGNIDDSWKPLFTKIIDKQVFRDIDSILNDNVLPERDSIFRVFEMPVSKIKIVILGQDPYSQPNQAVGLAFAVSAREKKPPSLLSIEKEVGHEIDRTLIPWTEQGVFLLNTALTVKKNIPGSHINLWKPFTAKVIQFISQSNPCIWMLWGNHAQSYTEYISNYVYQYRVQGEDNKNVVLIASHPAAESYKEDAGFYGCNHFEKANQILASSGKQIINW